MLKALMDFPYAGRTIRSGEYFTAVCESDRRVLVLASRAKEEDAPKAELIETEAADPEEEPEGHAADRPRIGRKPKRYSRRDMRAES